VLAALLTAASLTPQTGTASSSVTTSATSSGTATPEVRVATRDSSRGALLFSTKGCVGCHTHAAIPTSHMQIGPDLTLLPDRADTRVVGLDARAYARQSLREPSAYRVSGYSARMPDLGLSDEDIEALTAFLLSPQR